MTQAEFLWQRATRFAERPAIIDASGIWSYATLLDSASRVAAGLLGGLPDLAEERVAYLVAPGFYHVAAQWGIWLAGAIAVPIAQSHPAPEIEYLLDDSQPAGVIVSDDHSGRLAPLLRARGIREHRISRLAERRSLPLSQAGPPPGPPAVPVLPRLQPNRRALMVYTSGTTGRPKGVITTHANLRAQMATLAAAWGWTESDRSLHLLPLHHIHGIINALSCGLWSGATVEFMTAFEPPAAWERLASGEITFFTAVPTVYHRLIAAYDAADRSTRDRWSAGARGPRLMLSGSAALPVATLERWEAITGHRLLERYGMTEIGMALANPLHGERRAGTVGVPLPEVEARLVDETGAIVAPGQAGQIEVRGPQVFLQYWRRPEASAAAFHGDWFRTGDTAVVENGYWRILGRDNIDIIKSAGYKISALEIEEVLRQHPAITDCAVVGRPDADLGERVAAAVVAGPDLDLELLRTWLKERLAPYKIPREVRAVAELPRNAMGKVTKGDVKALFER
jgi:malonyl-CoA/methylmalonyl-CoA synthetase